MNPTPRRRLRELIGHYGTDLVSDSRRTRALLMDLCNDQPLEVSLLAAAQEERVAADLLKMPPGTPKPIFLDQLSRRLQQRRAFTPEASRWAVDSWALALGIVSSADLNSMPAAAPAPPPPNPAPSQAAPANPAPSQAAAAGAGPRTPPAQPKAPPRRPPAPPPPAATIIPPQASYGSSQSWSSAAELASSFARGALAIGPWALGIVRAVTRVLQTLRHTSRALREMHTAGLPRAAAIVLGGAFVGALSWAPGGALAGAVYGLLTATLGASPAGMSVMQLVLAWLALGMVVAALPGALTGALVGVIRFYGEVGGTVFGAFAGLLLGLALGPFSVSSVFQVGILTGSLFAVVSLGMLSGQGRNILALTAMAMGMAGASLRRSGGWAAVGRGALWGGLGSLAAFLPLFAVGFRGVALAALAGWAVGMLGGAVVGEKYKWLKIL